MTTKLPLWLSIMAPACVRSVVKFKGTNCHALMLEEWDFEMLVYRLASTGYNRLVPPVLLWIREIVRKVIGSMKKTNFGEGVLWRIGCDYFSNVKSITKFMLGWIRGRWRSPCRVPVDRGSPPPSGRHGGNGPEGFVRRRRGSIEERNPHSQISHRAWNRHQLGRHGEGKGD